MTMFLVAAGNMKGTLERVKQTHKAILFESFNGWQTDSFNLAMLLDGDYKDIDDKTDKISRLEVHSFKEFVEKFAPRIYEDVQQVGDTLMFSYSFDDGKGVAGIPIKLTEHNYYQMLSSMYGVKKDSGQSNRDFDDSKLKEILTPKAVEKEVRRIRKKATLLNIQYTEAVNKNENANFYAKQLQALGREVAEKAQGFSLSKLGLRIASINSQLEYLEEEKKSLKALPAGMQDAEIKRGVLDFDEEGKPTIQELESGVLSGEVFSSTQRLTTGESMKKLKAAVGNAIDNNAQSQNLPVRSFTKNMVLSTYLPDYEEESFALTPAGIVDKCRELEVKRNFLEKIYSQAQSEFIKTLKQVVNRMLGVKVFFDHATTAGGIEGELPKGQGLLVTNCPVGDLFDDRIKDKFEKFIVDCGVTQTGNRKLWFGILPHVVVGEINPDEQEDDGEIDPFNLDFDGEVKTKNATAVTTLAEAKQLLAIMQKARILTVFNPAVADDAPFTFGGITDIAVKDVKRKLENLGINYEHAVFSYPNFTIVRDAIIPLDNRENAEKINVGSIYIDAAYVAAGLLIASQQPEYLIKHGFGGRIDEGNVCVRLNLEEDEFVAKLNTHFNLELSGSWQKEIVDAISDDRFGFVFSGDPKSVGIGNETVDLENSYIFSARTMCKQNNVYQPIYKTLTNDFILSYLKTYGAKTTKSTFNKFLREDVNDWEEFTKRAEAKGIINVILRKNESITKSTSNANGLNVQLGDGDTFIEVDIVKE